MFIISGIVTNPTLALIGEKGPEAVVPLGSGGGGGGVTVNMTLAPQVSVSTLSTNEAELAVALTPVFNDAIADGRLTTEMVRRLEGIFQKQ